jgi:hypothetical protein
LILVVINGHLNGDENAGKAGAGDISLHALTSFFPIDYDFAFPHSLYVEEPVGFRSIKERYVDSPIILGPTIGGEYPCPDRLPE